MRWSNVMTRVHVSCDEREQGSRTEVTTAAGELQVDDTNGWGTEQRHCACLQRCKMGCRGKDVVLQECLLGAHTGAGYGTVIDGQEQAGQDSLAQLGRVAGFR